MLYRMLTGERPFVGSDVVGTLMAIAHDEPMAPRECNAAVPKGLSNFVLRLLAKDPSDRPLAVLGHCGVGT